MPAPTWAVGQANRSPDLDALPGFSKPPAGFGVVPFFWWLGDPLTRERLGWILEQMKGMGISGYQINYAHGMGTGGSWCGLSLPSDPPLLSKAWWELTGWFMEEAKKQGAAISLSDYTLGLGQGWIMDAILRERPDLNGTVLKMVEGRVSGALVTTNLHGDGGTVRPISILVNPKAQSLDPMHPESGEIYARKFFGQFEDRFPGEGGKGLNYFFSDELSFGVTGHLWDDRFAGEFKKRKGYDIIPELPALFMDIGPRTPKIRMDYSDVKVALTEEGFFKPVFDWHQKRGMTMGCDHGGRGRDVVEFGDYFRTQRWMQGPGSDQPNLSKDLIRAKVASSMAHLYQRPRVWLEGYYGSGWGTTCAGVVDATFADFVMGYNLLSFHGMYYSTHGGWWEWAPPDNTFRMPYWKHMRGFMDCAQRLSYLFTQGHHRCDVAILYPVAPMEAGLGGKEAVQAAFTSGKKLYDKSIDFDFMDFESLVRAKVVGKELQVSGESYRVLILPAMRAVRHSTLQKALEFRRAGGVVLAVDALPEASDRLGLNDPEVTAIVKELFPNGPVTDVLKETVAVLPQRDYDGPGTIQHRKLGPRDLYAIYNAPKDAEVTFRAIGKVELWDPWTGTSRPLEVIYQDAGVTKLKLPLTKTEIQLIVFSPGQPKVAAPPDVSLLTSNIFLTGDWEFELQPTSDNRYGDFHWPPTPAMIGAEARQVWYCEGGKPDGPWQKVTQSFGPQFIKGDKLPTDLRAPPTGGKPWDFSWRWGIENDPGAQGYHGLKARVHDDFLAIGAVNGKPWGNTEYKEGDTDTCFWTTVLAPRDMTANAHIGAVKPSRVWLNGMEVIGTKLSLKAGANPLVLLYDKGKYGRTYYAVSTSEPVAPEPDVVRVPAGQQPKFKPSPLATRWQEDKGLLPFDVKPDVKSPVGWYRFVSPPGLRGLTVKARGKVQVWVEDGGQKSEVRSQNSEFGIQKFEIEKPARGAVTVLVRIDQERGCYGGAALLEPIRLDCGVGSMALGDWSKNEGLTSYSGGAWYRKTVSIPAGKRVTLDLGGVAASAEVRVNGKSAGVRVSSPWTFDISSLVKPGENRIEVLVCNTLANHYCTVPTSYRGSPVSGLLGPVHVEVAKLMGEGLMTSCTKSCESMIDDNLRIVSDVLPPAVDVSDTVRVLSLLDFKRPELAGVKSALDADKVDEAFNLYKAILADRAKTLPPVNSFTFWLYSSARPEELLEGVLTTAHYGMGGTTTYTIGKPGAVDWFKIPGDGYDVVVRDISTMQWNSKLAEAYSKTGEKRFLDAYLGYWCDFADNFPAGFQNKMRDPKFRGLVNGTVNWSVTSRLYYAWRLETLGSGLCALLQRAKANNTLDDMDNVQLTKVLKHLYFWEAPTAMRFLVAGGGVPNQQLHLAGGMFLFSIFLNDMKDAEAWRRASMNTVMTGSGYLPDGTDMEQSFNYNKGLPGSMYHYISLAQALPTGQQGDWLPDMEQRLRYRLYFMNSIVMPMGGQPICGGNNTWDEYENSRKLMPGITDKDMVGKKGEYSLSDTIKDRFYGEGKMPEPGFRSIYFPYGGYYALRTDWSHDALYSFMKVSRPGRGHMREGNNAVVFSAFGRQLLINSGSNNYNPQTHIKEYGCSSISQNSIAVDGYGQNLNLDANPPLAYDTLLNYRFLDGKHFSFAEGLYDRPYGGWNFMDARLTAKNVIRDVRHKRQVLLLRDEKVWIVTDVVQSEQEHRFTQTWNFPPDFKENEVTANEGVIRAGRRGDVNIALYQFMDGQLDYNKYYGFKMEGRTLGWVAKEDKATGLDATPAADIHGSWRGKGEKVIITVVVPFKADNPVKSIRALKQGKAEGIILTLSDRRVVEYVYVAEKAEASLKTSEATLILLPGGGYEEDAMSKERLPIIVPTGFRWELDGNSEKPNYLARAYTAYRRVLGLELAVSA
jgi:hypothetical protein